MAPINCYSCVLAGLVVMAEPACAAFPSLDSDGNFNSGFGTLTLQFVSGSGNTAAGYEALTANTSGNGNTATGYQALHSNDADNNTATGYQALFANTTGGYNTAVGAWALYANTTGSGNTAVGMWALQVNKTGRDNTASGEGALMSNTRGSLNTASGREALRANTNGSVNTAVGMYSLYNNTTGSFNIGIGGFALESNLTGTRNTVVGNGALSFNTAGSNNIAIGYNAAGQTSGSNNIVVGNPGVAGENKAIRIGNQGTQIKTFIAGIRGATVTGGAVVVVSKAGQLGVQTSSRRFKQGIRPMGDASSALLKLKPVTFRYKEADEEGQTPKQFGLIAEDVARVLPELVLYDEFGRPETVAYQTLSSLLLNEFLKEHDKLAAVTTQTESQAWELRSIKAQAASAVAKAEMAVRELSLARVQAADREQELKALRADMVRLEKVTQQLMAGRPSTSSVAQVNP